MVPHWEIGFESEKTDFIKPPEIPADAKLTCEVRTTIKEQTSGGAGRGPGTVHKFDKPGNDGENKRTEL